CKSAWALVRLAWAVSYLACGSAAAALALFRSLSAAAKSCLALARAASFSVCVPWNCLTWFSAFVPASLVVLTWFSASVTFFWAVVTLVEASLALSVAFCTFVLATSKLCLAWSAAGLVGVALSAILL